MLRFKQAEIQHFVMKPITAPDLYSVIHSVLKPGLDLPQTKDRLDSSKVSGTSFGSTKTLRILLAEDNQVNQKLAIRILEKMGMNVSVANAGVETVNLWKTGQYDLI